MKTKIIPFDLETAKKIQAGEVKGKIKTRDSKDVDEIVIFRAPLEYSIYAVINGICHSFVKEGYEMSWDKSGRWEGDLVLEVPDNEPQFKPFDKVLVRDWENEDWIPALFGYSYIVKGSTHYRTVGGAIWMYCIPYEGNENLLGTTDKPKED